MMEAVLEVSGRYLSLGTREDEPSSQLLMVLPGISPVGVRLASASLRLAHRLTGYVPRAFRYPFEGDIPRQYEAAARMTFFDEACDRYLPTMAQFVLLGAGFDTRALRLPKDRQVRSFEVDTPKTQAIKREMLSKTSIDATSITFVSADFEKEDWFTRLVDAGFDQSKPSLFLWEGVVMYLDREAVEDTLRKIGSCCYLNQFRSLFRLISFFVIRLEALWKRVYGIPSFNGPDTILFQAALSRFSRTLADQAKGKRIVF